MNWGLTFKTFLVLVGGGFGYLFGGVSVLLQVLLAFMFIDWFSGLIASYVEGKLSSKVGYVGIAKKVMILAIIVLSHFIDNAMHLGNTVRDGVIFFYLGNESLSFVENAGRMGVPLPAQLINAVQVLKSKGDDK
jgi:toxin secretion/phage lysis holin